MIIIDDIIEYLLHTPDDTNLKVLKDMMVTANIDSEIQNKVIQYAMETPYNMNGNMLKFLLEPTPPTSNKTKFHMNLSSKELSLTLLFMQTIDEDTTIDWGDGTVEIAKNNVPEGQNTSTRNTHIYELAGEYTITLSNNSGSIILDGRLGNNNQYNIFGEYSNHTLEEANIGLNTSKIEVSAFYYCDSLQSITISDSVTEIGKGAFYMCTSLQSITIPKGITKIGVNTFYYCIHLQSVTIPNSVTEIGKSAFYDCRCLQSINIPDGVTEIDMTTFFNCYDLQSVTIPNSVTKIGISAFRNCTSLQSITIPNSITEIGNYTFSSCTSLQSITIPNNVTKIGISTFNECTSMQSYHFMPTNPPTLGNNSVFQNIPNDCIIYVPQESVNAYKTAQYWSSYASYIQGE